MRLVPGMSVAKADGNLPSVAYHGTQARDQRRMLVLVDGRSVYQPGFARVNWNAIPVALEDVERIEVTRGPASAAYGANAFTGVINIITRDPRDVDGQQTRVRAGNNGVLDSRVAAAHQFDNGAWRLSLNDRRDHGYDADLPPWTPATPSASPPSTVARCGSSTPRYLHGARRRQPHPPGPPQRTRPGSHRRLPRRQPGARRTRLPGPGMAAPGVAAPPVQGEPLRPVQQRGHQPGPVLPGPDHRHPGPRRRPLLLQGATRPLPGQRRRHRPDPGQRRRRPGHPEPLRHPAGQRRRALLRHRLPGRARGTLRPGAPGHPAIAPLGAVGGGPQPAPGPGRVPGVPVRHRREPEPPPVHQPGAETPAAGDREPGRLLGARRDQRPPLQPPRRRQLGTDTRPHPARRVRPRPAYPGHLRGPGAHQPADQRPVRPLWRPPGPARLGPGLFLRHPAQPRHPGPGTHPLPGAGLLRALRRGRPGRLRAGRALFPGRTLGPGQRRLNPFNFEPNNNSEVSHRGTEAQLSWRPSGRHLLRLTGAHIHTRATSATETRLAARDSASALWLWRFRRDWWWSTGYYLARDYNDYPFERLDAQLGWRQRLAGAEWEWRLQVQQPLNSEPVVFAENEYQDDQRYWLTVTVNF
ncbi:TonB-dependent receptor plug domain-containing protein [Alcanivorax sp. IO_7]|nr:TonB-dependent receptor plug domain-containing protein [Alcanivorax sp. IO_7]